jgi:penicillin G amidase
LIDRARIGLLGSLLTLCSALGAQPWQSLATQRLARLAGEVRVPGLHAPVRVQRDRWGVPHIYAGDQHDLFFAQGFVVAQDRLFQMELWKRAGQGRLAEVLGASAIGRDINARRLRYRGEMPAEFASYAPDTQSILEAFTAGINAYIRWIQQPGGPGLPVEFEIAQFKPEPWQPADCLNRLAAYAMMGNASSELRHAVLTQLLGARAATRVFDFDPQVELDPAPGMNFSGLSPELLAQIVGSDQRMPFVPSRHESNDWTIAGRLTVTGKPLLANDPHRVIAQPSLRYIVHLHAPGWNVIGAGEPALPGVALGHNERIAWGFTIFGLDQEDLYLETLRPGDPRQYRSASGWERMSVERAVIHVRGAPDVVTELHFTRHGPVLWEDGTRALALRWIGAEPGSAGYLGSLSVDRARDWTDFERAMPRWKVPSENIVYADVDGNIGEHSTGLAPLRRNFTGLLPLPGDDAHEWAGYIANSALPHSYNPPEGFIATANQRMIPEGFPYAVGYEWADPTRFLRIRAVLEQAREAGHALSVADMEALQTDVVSLPAQALTAWARREATRAPPAAGAALKLLLEWDGALRADSPAAALYEVWMLALRSEITRRSAPAAALPSLELFSAPRVVAILLGAPSRLFGADPVSRRDELLWRTLAQSFHELEQKLGADTHHWSWGQLHPAVFRHSLDALGGRELLDRGPVARPGDGEAVQATWFDDDGSFEQRGGASYREIFDLSDWDNALAINVPGQSGQPGAPHFDDLLPLWTRGEYFPLKFSQRAVDAVTSDVLTLHP